MKFDIVFERDVLVLETLLEYVNVLYQNCSSDRGKLHEIEWKSDEGEPSILGETEIISDHNVGCVRNCLNKKLKNKEEIINELKIRSIFDSEVLTQWIIDESLKYKDYFAYIQSVENLRTTAIKILKKY